MLTKYKRHCHLCFGQKIRNHFMNLKRKGISCKEQRAHKTTSYMVMSKHLFTCYCCRNSEASESLPPYKCIWLFLSDRIWSGKAKKKKNNNKTYSYICVCSVIHSCPILCDPLDYSPPGSSVHRDSPDKNTGVGCHALLQRIFPTQGSHPGLLHCRQFLYCLSHQGSPFFYLHLSFLIPIIQCLSI